MKQTLLQRLIDRRDRLDAAIEVLRDEFGEEMNRKIMQRASKALKTSSNGGAPAIAGILERQERIDKKQPARKPPNEKTNRYAFRGTDREIKQIQVPSGVSFEGVPPDKAVALAVRAVNEPLPTPELRLLLETAGVKFPKIKMPRNRYVGMLAARMAAEGEIERTAKGWIAKGKAAH